MLLQVNISGEATKSGVATHEVAALAAEVARLPRLVLRGLMAIPEPESEPGRQVEPLLRMKALFDSLRQVAPALGHAVAGDVGRS